MFETSSKSSSYLKHEKHIHDELVQNSTFYIARQPRNLNQCLGGERHK